MIDKGEIGAVPNIEEINLSKDVIKEPLNASRVQENHFITAAYSPEKPWLITYGLSACKGIVFLDKSRKSALMAHLASVKDLGVVIRKMVGIYRYASH